MNHEQRTMNTGPLPIRHNAPKIELCSTLSLSKGLPCVAFCEAGSSLGPLHLSRTLYKSTLFMQNKPNLVRRRRIANSVYTRNYKIFIPLAGYKNKPKQSQFKKGQNEYKLNYNKGLQKKRQFFGPNKQTQSCPP